MFWTEFQLDAEEEWTFMCKHFFLCLIHSPFLDKIPVSNKYHTVIEWVDGFLSKNDSFETKLLHIEYHKDAF